VLAVAGVVAALGARGTVRSADAAEPGSHVSAAAGTPLTEVGPPPRGSDGRVAVAARYTGPQGAVGQFVAKCLYSHSGHNDPIVWPGYPGRSHRHDFYGAVGTDARSTARSLARGDSTCDKPGDDAAYWQPTLYDHGVAVVPLEAHAYYRAAPGVAPATLKPFPPGLALIAGDPTATRPAAGDAAGWTCGVRTQLDAAPPACDQTAPLHLVLTFPDCWDGVHTDTPGHRDQATYSERGQCPASHPVPIPQLTLTVTFPIWGTGHELRLSSGSVYSAHGDFLNAWNPAALAREIAHCLVNNVMCDVASDREQVPPFFTQ
jgi:hypothetical protein